MLWDEKGKCKISPPRVFILRKGLLAHVEKTFHDIQLKMFLYL